MLPDEAGPGILPVEGGLQTLGVGQEGQQIHVRVAGMGGRCGRCQLGAQLSATEPTGASWGCGHGTGLHMRGSTGELGRHRQNAGNTGQ